MFKKLRFWIQNNEPLLILIILAIVLRIPSLFEPYWYGDEGIYLTLGEALRKGLVWYRDIHDNKPPLLYLLAAVTGTVFYFRLLLLFWFSAAVAIFYRLMRQLLPRCPRAWQLSTLALIILTTVFEGNIANAEIYIVLPVVAGLYLTLKPRPNWWLIGLFFSAGFLFKVPAAFDLVALGVWLVFWQKINLKSLLKLGLGFGLPILISTVYYAYQGAAEPYIRSALMQNIGYLKSWGGSQNGLVIRFLAAAAATIGSVFLSKKFRLPDGSALTVIWFIWAMFGALLSERPYPHYLIQPAVPLAILLSFFIFSRRKLLKIIILIVGFLAGLSYCQIRFWQYPIITYYQNFIEYALGKKPVEAYRSWFDIRVNQNYRLAEYIKNTTLPDDRIFIWGDEPNIYALSRRLPIGRYTVAYHIIDFDGFAATIKAWDQNQPKIVLVMNYESTDFPEINARLTTDYVLVETVEQTRVYRRLNKDNP